MDRRWICTSIGALECESFQFFCSFFYHRALLIFQSYRSSENCRVNWNSRSYSQGLINISFLPQFLTLSFHRRTSKSHTKNIHWLKLGLKCGSVRFDSLFFTPPHIPSLSAIHSANVISSLIHVSPSLNSQRSRTHVWASKWWKKRTEHIFRYPNIKGNGEISMKILLYAFSKASPPYSWYFWHFHLLKSERRSEWGRREWEWETKLPFLCVFSFAFHNNILSLEDSPVETSSSSPSIIVQCN